MLPLDAGVCCINELNSNPVVHTILDAGVCCINELNSNPIIHTLFPRLSLTDLKIFSNVSKECFSMYQKYLHQLCFSGNIYREKLKVEMLPIARPPLLQKKMHSTNQSAINKTEIFTYYEELLVFGIKEMQLQRFDLISQKTQTFGLGGPASSIQKVVLGESKVYAVCNNHQRTWISILDFKDTNFSKVNKISLERKPFTTIDMDFGGTIAEVHQGKLYVGRAMDTIKIYNSETEKLISEIKCEDADSTNKIVGIKIDCDRLYIRLFKGTIHIYDLGTQKKLQTVLGPDCQISQEHFEVKNSCLYTASNFSVQKWEISQNNKISLCDEIKLNPKKTQNIPPEKFNFQLDGKIIYVGLFGNIAEAYEIVDTPTGGKFEYLANLSKLTKKHAGEKMRKCYVNEGIIFTSLYQGLHQHYEITNLNPSIRSLDAIPDPKVSTLAKIGYGIQKIFHSSK